jgi:predicted DNA-binding ribbon-helix-helix protein
VKRSFVIAGQKRSISLEEAVWRSLREIASYQDVSLLALLTTIESTRSPAIRLFVLNFYREQLELQSRNNCIEGLLRSPIQALH